MGGCSVVCFGLFLKANVLKSKNVHKPFGKRWSDWNCKLPSGKTKFKKRILKQIHSFYIKNIKWKKKKISQELIKKPLNFSQDMTAFLSVFLQPIICRFSTYLLLYLFECWVYLREKVDWDENNRMRLHCFRKSSIFEILQLHRFTSTVLLGILPLDRNEAVPQQMENIHFIAVTNPEDLHSLHHILKRIYLNFLVDVNIKSDKTSQPSFNILWKELIVFKDREG